MELLGDIDVIVGGLMSPNFLNLRDKTKIQPVLSKIEDVDIFLNSLYPKFDYIYGLIKKRKRGEFPKEIPLFKEE